MGEGDTDWERAHLRVEENAVGEADTDWERAHLIRLEGVKVGVTDLERAHLIGWEWVEEGDADRERAHLRVEGNEWRRETPTGRERT